MITKENKHPESFQKEINEAISKIEDKQKEEVDNKESEKLRQKFLKKYSDVFTKKLRIGDAIKCSSVKIETKNDRNIKHLDCRTPIPVQLHLRKAANQELTDFVKAGIIEKCHHFTPWLSCWMFISKK